MITAKDILKVLTTQTFANFYGEVIEGDQSMMTKFICGDEDAPTEEEILKEIESVFRLKG
jgi:hypothetical protein